jgi:glyoxylase-like metal-dependent hydrolase (beta-lactamase superfamily II)
MINCFLVVEDDGSATLIDTNVPGSASAILKAARQLGATIRRILLTHAHFDHVGSLDALHNSLPAAEISIGVHEAPLLAGDFSAYGCKPGQRAPGFMKTSSHPVRIRSDGEMIGSLRTILSPGHTPGHVAYLDTRDRSLIAGDSFTTKPGVMAAGVFKFYFPFPALFSWNPGASASSARKLCELRPTRLAVGHGPTVANPLELMERSTEEAEQQSAPTPR